MNRAYSGLTVRFVNVLTLGVGTMLVAGALRADTPTQPPASQEVKVRLSLDSGGAGATKDAVADNLQTLLETVIDDARVKVVVRGPLNGQYVAVLSGKPIGESALQHAAAMADKLKRESNLNSLVIVNAMQKGDSPKADPIVSYQWILGHLLGDTAFDGKQDLSKLADALNALFPSGDKNCPLVSLKNTTFWLHGPQSLVRTVRGLLVLIDAPAPQVKLEMWAVQYAGSQQSVGEQMRQVTLDIKETQWQVEIAKAALAFAVHKNAELIESNGFRRLKECGFDVNPKGSLSLIETLICIGVSKNPKAVLEDAQAYLKDYLDQQFKECHDPHSLDLVPICDLNCKRSSIFSNLMRLWAPPGDGKYMLEAAQQLSHEAAEKGVIAFADSLERYYVFMDALEVNGPAHVEKPDEVLKSNPNASEELALASLPINRHLERVVKAFAADMDAMYFQPLLKRAQHPKGGYSGGVGLAGRTSIVVTSRLPASVAPDLETYAEKQVPRTLGSDFIPNLLKSAAAGPNGAATLLPGLTNLEQGLVLAALQPTADVSFFKVAPGIGVNVTPAMTPDGNSANLNLDVHFGVETNIKKDSTSDTLAYRPPDAVKSHKITTTATVGGFNLFEISSFNVETMTPRTPFILPVFGNLPLIGNMFRFSRRPNQTFHQSIILTNAMLVPRALGMVNLYAGNFAGSRWIAKKARSGKIESSQYRVQERADVP